jgi:hypothetical protein
MSTKIDEIEDAPLVKIAIDMYNASRGRIQAVESGSLQIRNPRLERLLTTHKKNLEDASQQLELENVHRRKKEGCCSQFIGWTVKALHVTDICLGMALIIYGSLLRTQFEQPAMAAVVFCLILGSIILVASAAGIFSYATPSCSRWGLLVSGLVAPYLAAVYVTLIIALAMNSSGFFMYLEDHHDVMYMGENVVENLNRLMPLLYTILGMLTALELTR